VASQAPLHEAGVELMLGTITTLGSMVKAMVVSQPLASLKVTV
jgi:hypothetical protein